MSSNMKTIVTSASACLMVVLIASVGAAESKLEASDEPHSEVASNDESGSHSAAELSTAPLDHVEYPQTRPDWVTQRPDLDSEVQIWVVNADDCESAEQCETKLEPLVHAAVDLYITELTGWQSDDAFVDDLIKCCELVEERYEGEYIQGDSKRYEIAVRLGFDSSTRTKIRQAAQNVEVGDRLRATAGLFALAVVGLFISSGILNVFRHRVS